MDGGVPGGSSRATPPASRPASAWPSTSRREPASRPIARGGEIYRASCAGCHGDAGRADGPDTNLRPGLDPPPADLADWKGLRAQTPLDYYRRISFGSVGTAMPAFDT